MHGIITVVKVEVDSFDWAESGNSRETNTYMCLEGGKGGSEGCQRGLFRWREVHLDIFHCSIFFPVIGEKTSTCPTLTCRYTDVQVMQLCPRPDRISWFTNCDCYRSMENETANDMERALYQFAESHSLFWKPRVLDKPLVMPSAGWRY